MNSVVLSKSLYTKGIQCPKALWLKKLKPDVLTPIDDSAETRFNTGNIVGELYNFLTKTLFNADLFKKTDALFHKFEDELSNKVYQKLAVEKIDEFILIKNAIDTKNIINVFIMKKIEKIQSDILYSME